jgi:hypothetical protein
MKRSIWSERNLVVILFITVIVIFSFAQAYSNKVEKMFLDSKTASSTVSQGKSTAAFTKATTAAEGFAVTPLH